MQTLHAQILLAEGWLSSKEAFVADYDLGDSVDTVDMLIRKHDNFEKTLHAQGDKLDALRAGVHILDECTEPDVDRIRGKYESVLERHSALLEACRTKRDRLEDSLKLHDFIRSCAELVTWINAKLQLAYDESFVDPANLRSKLQRHQAFHAELQQSEQRVLTIRAEGEKLASEVHYGAEQVQAQLDEVTGGWTELQSVSARKMQLLQHSYAAYQLVRKVNFVDKWLDQVSEGRRDQGKGLLFEK